MSKEGTSRLSKANPAPKVYCSFTKMVPLEELIPNPRNPKRHPESQVALLAKIISAQGWRNPIVVSKRSGFITKGHARLEAARKLALSEAPVDYQAYKDEASEWADMLADNRIAELANIDGPTLKDLLEEMDTGAFDMDLTGYDPKSIEELMTELHVPGTGNTDTDQIPAKVPSRCKKGDVWKLGDHRLLCGDVTDLSAMDNLMAGAQAHMVWTDPPYGVKYENKLVANNAQHYRVRQIENDNLSPEQLEDFLRSALINMAVQCVVGAPIYVACPTGDMLPVMIAAFSDSGFKFHRQQGCEAERLPHLQPIN